MAVCTLESSCFFTNHGVIIDHGPTTRVAARGTCWGFECKFFHGFCKHFVWFFGFSCSLEQAFESLVLCVFVQVLELFLRENCGEEREFGLLLWCAWIFWRNFCGWWLHRIKGEGVEWFLPWCNLCIYCWVWW